MYTAPTGAPLAVPLPPSPSTEELHQHKHQHIQILQYLKITHMSICMYIMYKESFIAKILSQYAVHITMNKERKKSQKYF